MNQMPFKSTDLQNQKPAFLDDLLFVPDEDALEHFATWLDQQLDDLEECFKSFSTSHSVVFARQH